MPFYNMLTKIGISHQIQRLSPDVSNFIIKRINEKHSREESLLSDIKKIDKKDVKCKDRCYLLTRK